MGINVQGKDEHGVDRLETALIPSPSEEYMCRQVLQRIRRETGVFWYTGFDHVIERAVQSMYVLRWLVRCLRSCCSYCICHCTCTGVVVAVAVAVAVAVGF